MKKTLLLFAAIALNSITSAQTFVSTTPQNRNVVLEEFTGINCTFCPNGHSIANQLVANNPGRVVVVNVHVGGFAAPDDGQPDFRTSFGGPLTSQAAVSGYPAATVNRQVFQGLGQNTGGTGMGRGNWTNAANQVLPEASPVNVAARASVNLATRELTVVVEAYYTANSDAATNRLTVALMQSNIEGPQVGAEANPSAILPNGNYLHMHALRHFLTGQWGATISNTEQGSFFTDTYTYTLPDDIRSIPLVMGDLEVAVWVAEGNQYVITGSMAELEYVSPNAFDALPFFTEIGEFVCGDEISPKVTIQNLGSEPLTSLDILYSVNGGPASTYNWSGNLATAARTDVTLPTIAFGHLEQNTLWVATQNPNGQGDQQQSNDIMMTEFLPARNSGNEVVLTILTDNYGDETTWELVDPNGNVISSGGPYGNNQTITETFTLENGCHEFIIIDEFGDGICCAYGNGFYKIESNGVTVYEGGQFASIKSRVFNVGGVANVEQVDAVSGLTVYPNPFQSEAILRFHLNTSQNVRVNMHNTLGQNVMTQAMGHLNPGQHAVNLSAHGLPAGMYLVSVETNDRIQTMRVVIGK
jgi:thiol-disulfide isomerase/thioredoxin